MTSYEFGSCFAQWNGKRLSIGNSRFTRVWSWKNGQLFPTVFDFEGVNWLIADEYYPASPSAPGAPSFQGEPQLRAEESGQSTASEPYLSVTLTAGEISYEFRLWEGLAGCAQRVTFPAAKAEVTTTTNEAVSGVEVDGPVKSKQEQDGNIQEHFKLTPHAHVRLLAPELLDQTDIHSELVKEREWMLKPREREVVLQGTIFVLEEVINSSGLIFVKHAPLPHSRTYSDGPDFVMRGSADLTLRGHGAAEGEGDWWGTFAYTGGTDGRIGAIHQYQRQWRRYRPEQDGLLLANTWGDRSRDAHLSQEFMTREVEAAAQLGVDVVQIDDGWQQGTTANSAKAKEKGGVWNGFWASDANFWDINRSRFPDGLEPLLAAAEKHRMKFGLWFAPDSSNDSNNWEKDADAILRHHRELGVQFFKIDALKLESKLGERRSRAFFQKVLDESHGAVTFDQDITAEDRFGYFGCLEPGPLFVENRYTDWRAYWPHYTLRVGWQLVHWVDPVRLRLEWLNVARNSEMYLGDPLAPARWRPDALFATVMFFAPLSWFEVQNLPHAYFEEAAPLIAVWKQHREEMQRGSIRPIGSVPDGVSWTGFRSWNATGGYVLAFRELNSSESWSVQLPNPAATSCEILGGRGDALVQDGFLKITVPGPLDFVWVRVF